VRAAAVLPERDEPPKAQRQRRPGWALPLVREVLEQATEPMTAMEIERRFGEPIAHPTVFHVLTRSRPARSGCSSGWRRAVRARATNSSVAGQPWSCDGLGGTVNGMTTKERLHQVVDAISEQEAADALKIFVSRRRVPLARCLNEAPLDDEPLTAEERDSLRDARQDAATGHLISMDDLRRELG
jgi:hypothetical protein